MYYKSLCFLTASCLIACQSNVPSTNKTNQKSSFFIKNTASKQPQSRSTRERYKSSLHPDIIRKTFLKESFKAVSQKNLNLEIDAEDLNRVFILTFKRASNVLEGVSVSVNGQSISDLETKPSVTSSDISIPLTTLKSGLNQVSVQDSSGKADDIEIELVGIIKPENIPDAVHSRVPDGPEIRRAEHVKGRIGIKFLEGMKIREKQGESASLYDESGLSLATLKTLMKKHGVRSVHRALGDDYEKWDQWERKAEEHLRTEVSNLNLFYYLELNPDDDIWPVIDELRKLPFIEEAFADFIPTSPSPYNPNDPQLGDSSLFPNDPSYGVISKDLWLRNIHVQANGNGTYEPGPNDDGAWSITQGDQNITVALLERHSPQNSAVGAHVPSTHEDLSNTPYLNENVPSSGYTDNDVGHATSSAGIIAATGNNSIGVAGVAFRSNLKTIQVDADGAYSSSCNGTGSCSSGWADSIIWAYKLGARVIVANITYDNQGTAEHNNSLIRAVIANVVAQGVVVCIPAGNSENLDIRKMPSTGLPTPDTGSIIVGGLKIDGSQKHTNYNYGKSQIEDIYYTIDGHGTDVSGPAEAIWTTGFSNHSVTDYYSWFGGTSGAVPAVGGVVALMLAIKPDLTPLEIRKTLRTTADTHNTDNDCTYSYTKCISGMVNAYKAVSYYSSGSGSGSQTGLYAKFYDSTIFPPEVMLNTLPANNNLEFNHKPYAVKTLTTVNASSSGSDPFGVGLKSMYAVDIKGKINVPTTGNYTFAVYHDDQISLHFDNYLVLEASRSTDGYSYVTVYLTAGSHQISLFRNQINGTANLSLWWLKPGSSYEVVPSSALSHSTAIHETPDSTYENNFIGRFFEGVTALPLTPSWVGTGVMPSGSKKFENLNYYPGPNPSGDQFGVGYSNNFGALFTGYIKLPSGYPSGTYQFKFGHDDGAQFYLDGQLKVNSTAPTTYIEHTVSHYLASNTYYPFAIQYAEVSNNAYLSLKWKSPSATSFYNVPYNAFWF